ncbi:MAG: hypothetical protein ACR2IK_20480 [Chloroflexota bacterium]
MKRTPGLVLSLIGLALLAAGLTLGYSAVHRDGISCGSAFGGASSKSGSEDIYNALIGAGLTSVSEDCASARSDRKTFALAAAIPGVVILLGGVGLYTTAASRTPGSWTYGIWHGRPARQPATPQSDTW